MKIFFHAPIRQRETDDYILYYKYIEELGHSHVTDFAIKFKTEDLQSEGLKKEAEEIQQKQEDRIKKADIVILGATDQSVGTGYYFAMASKLSKPIIAICKDKKQLPFFYHAIDYNKLIIIECNTENYKKVINKALKEGQKLIDKRFTLLLPPDVVEMLDNHYIKSGETRSEYIRDLIRSDQKSNNQILCND